MLAISFILLYCGDGSTYYYLYFLRTHQEGITHNMTVGSAFANGPGDRGSIPGQVIPKTLKNGT